MAEKNPLLGIELGTLLWPLLLFKWVINRAS